ncbi:MAG: hypothetical protein EXR76_00090 [Myxococcales bacterium]|nr:hypothetical protein [Myxococcales bacterium]
MVLKRLDLALALAPLLIYSVTEAAFGAVAALAVTVVYAAVELLIRWVRTRIVDRLSLFMTGFIVTMGVWSLAADDERIAQIVPIVGDLVIITVLVVGLARGRPLLVTLAEQQMPELGAEPAVRAFLKGVTWRFTAGLCLHALATTWATLFAPEAFSFAAGPLQYLIFGLQFGIEFLLSRRLPRPPEETPASGGTPSCD